MSYKRNRFAERMSMNVNVFHRLLFSVTESVVLEISCFVNFSCRDETSFFACGVVGEMGIFRPPAFLRFKHHDFAVCAVETFDSFQIAVMGDFACVGVKNTDTGVVGDKKFAVMCRIDVVTVNDFISVAENGIFFGDTVSVDVFQTGIFGVGDVTPFGDAEVAAAPEALAFFVPDDAVCALEKVLAERGCARLFGVKFSDVVKFEIMSFTGSSYDVAVGEKFSGVRI